MRSTDGSGLRLQDRRAESEALHRLVENARAGTSGVVVLRGEAGVGKTALLDHLLVDAAGCRVVLASGVESEMEMAFAGLHQLCAPFLDRLDRLPAPQREALGTAFGLQTGDPPDRFLVGLAVLSLLSEVAEEQPLVCILDDVQWLDRASTQVLGFVARRLAAEAVVLIFALREPGEEENLIRLPQVAIGPLPDADLEGTMAHLGRVHVEMRHCTPDVVEFFTDTGVIDFVAASGDVLHGTYSTWLADIVGDQLTSGFEISFDGTGSTGRFAGATGSADGEIVLTVLGFDPEHNVWPATSWELDGTITY